MLFYLFFLWSVLLQSKAASLPCYVLLDISNGARLVLNLNYGHSKTFSASYLSFCARKVSLTIWLMCRSIYQCLAIPLRDCSLLTSAYALPCLSQVFRCTWMASSPPSHSISIKPILPPLPDCNTCSSDVPITKGRGNRVFFLYQFLCSSTQQK